jgi:hypothetical protein
MKLCTAVQEGCGYNNTLGAHHYFDPLAKYLLRALFISRFSYIIDTIHDLILVAPSDFCLINI